MGFMDICGSTIEGFEGAMDRLDCIDEFDRPLNSFSGVVESVVDVAEGIGEHVSGAETIIDALDKPLCAVGETVAAMSSSVEHMMHDVASIDLPSLNTFGE